MMMTMGRSWGGERTFMVWYVSLCSLFWVCLFSKNLSLPFSSFEQNFDVHSVSEPPMGFEVLLTLYDSRFLVLLYLIP